MMQNPFNGIESDAVGRLPDLMRELENPFNGIESSQQVMIATNIFPA